MLKDKGSADSQTLAARLGITPMAVRQHLYALRRDKLVISRNEARPYGRPAKSWRLSEIADRLFPDAHADLVAHLLGSVKVIFGEKGLEQILKAWSKRELALIKSRMPSGSSLRTQVDELARVRREQGYMAVMRPSDGDTMLLIENHCPIRRAAAECEDFCNQELHVFQKAFGSRVTVERAEHFLGGDQSCLFIIKRKS